MTIEYDKIFQGVVQGVAAAVVFWSFGVLRDRLRNIMLRYSIKRQLKKVGCGGGIYGITTEVRNHLQKSFTVREVKLLTSRGEYLFNATGVVSTSAPPKKFKPSKEEKAKLERGEMIEGPVRIEHRSWQAHPTHSGFVEVLPFTSQGFVLPAELFHMLQGETLGLSTTVEYETWTKKTRLLEQQSQGWALDTVKMNVTKLQKEILSGTFNQARAMFRMAPVQVPNQTATASADDNSNAGPQGEEAQHP